MSVLKPQEVIDEIVFFLRNSDILTIAVRGVTTASDSGTFASDLTHLIDDSAVKNIRSITVGGSPLTYGADFIVDTNFLDTTIKTQITFTVAQTGAFVISYDTGSDKIFPDFPKDTLSIGSYPRIAVDILSATSAPQGFGNQQIAIITDVLFTVVAYADNTRDINDILGTVKEKFQDNQNGFNFFKITTADDMGPMIVADNTKQQIMHRNQDFVSTTNIERP